MKLNKTPLVGPLSFYFKYLRRPNTSSSPPTFKSPTLFWKWIDIMMTESIYLKNHIVILKVNQPNHCCDLAAGFCLDLSLACPAEVRRSGAWKKADMPTLRKFVLKCKSKRAFWFWIAPPILMDFWQQRLRGAATSRLGLSKFKKHDLHTNLAIPKEFHDHFDQYRLFIKTMLLSSIILPLNWPWHAVAVRALAVCLHILVWELAKRWVPSVTRGFTIFLFVYSISYKYT